MKEFSKFLRIEAYVRVYLDPRYPPEEDDALAHVAPVFLDHQCEDCQDDPPGSCERST